MTDLTQIEKLTAERNALVSALTRIRYARDYHAEHAKYPPGWLGEDCAFDDWAADIADTVLAQVQK